MATKIADAGGTTASFSNTPQANDDVFNLTEDTVVLASGSQTIIVLDVMANDQGGNAKSLFSVDDGISASTATKQYAPIDLTTQDVQATGISAWESIGGGVSIRINNGKVEMDLSGYLAAHGFASLQAMGAGDQINETFTYAIKLGGGTLSWASVSVNIQGTNDGAIITAVPGADLTVVEAGGVANGTLNDPNAHGQLVVTDPDVGQNHFQAPPSLQGTYGSFAFDTTTGVWAYTLNQTLADPLSQGQPVTDTLTVKSADGTASYNIVVNITGSNDAPVAIANVNSVKEDTAPNPVSGNVLTNDTDVDTGDTHSVTAVNGSAGNVGANLVGTYGTLHLNSDGTYTYTLNNGLASVQALAAGASVTDVFTYTNADNHGGSSSASLTVTINGTNDAPVAVADINSVKEDTAPNPVSGNVLTNDTDVDTGDTHSVTAVNGSAGNVGANLVGTYGTLHLNSDGTYTYTLNNGLASVQALAAGASVTDVFTYTNADNHGGSSSASLTVTINGTNDAPVAVADINSVKEDTAPNPVSGNVLTNDTDVDTGDTHSVTAVNGSAGNVGANLVGTYGTLHLNSDGTYTYTLNNGLASVQALAAGASVTDVFTYTNADNHGGSSSASLTVTINGTNDAPVAVADINSVKEDTAPNPVSGNVLTNDTDVDTGDTHSVTAVNGSAGNVGANLVGTYGTLHLNSDGTYTYTLNNGLASVQALAAGASVTDVFTYTNADNHGGSSSASLTVTINGTNDGPVAVADINSVKEDTAPNPVSGNVLTNDTDVDTGDTHSVTAVNGSAGNVGANLVGTYGTLHLNSDGTYTYTLNNGLASVQALAAGASVTDVFTYTNADNHGGSSSASLTVTINGTNDAPVAVADINSVKEHTAPNPVSGNVLTNDTDVDTGDTHSVTAVNGSAGNVGANLVGTYGTLHLNSDGTYTYTLNNGLASVQALAAGASVTDVFTYTNADNHGGPSSASLTVTINGTNDGPVITSGVQTGSVTEDTQLTATGQVQASDVDNGATQAYSGDATGTYGSFVVDASTGAWTYTLDNAAHQNLAQGESHTDTFTVTVTDDFGATTTQDVTVTINGTNDGPVITSGVQTGSVTEDTQLTATGQVQASDVDNGATQAYSGDATGTYGSFVVDASTGAWTYTLDNAAHQNLAQGESHTDTFTVTVTDDFGATTTQDVTVTINGTNDGPVITSGVQTGSVTEDTQLTATGQVQASDVDNGATQAYSGDATGTYGSFVVDASTGAWTYTLDNAAHQNLAQGESHTDTFTVTVTDDFGATTTQDVTVTINGTNDGPVITSGVQTGSVTEDTQLTATGQVQASDVDNGATQAYSGDATGTYGSFVVDASTGAWTYTLDNAAHQNLAQGESHTDTFTVTVTDDFGATTTQDVTVTINGTNDGPVITSGVQTGSVTEDTQLTATGQVQASDVDNGATQAYSGDATGTYGSFVVDASTGAWTYTLDNAAHQNLAQGESHTDTFTVTVTDDFGATTTQDVTVTINGTNDGPVITSGVQTGSVTEDTQLTATGQVQASDVDNGATQAYSGDATGTYGSFVVDASTGAWTYTLDNAAHQNLAQGESHTDTFTVTVTDDFGATTTQDVTVTINGTNDGPVITSGVQTGSVTEDTQLTATGQVQASDVDNGATQAYSGDATGTYGSFVVDASTGAWTYTLDNAAHQNLAQGESHTDTFTVTVTDDFGATTTQDVTVTINGTNDGPVITSGVQTGSVTEDTQLTATGQVQASDVDNGATQAYSGDATGTYGSFVVDASTGAWTYTLDNAAHQNLAQGESHTDTFTVTVTDDFGATTTQDVTVTINGTNDGPVITSGVQTGSVTEDTQLTATGQVQASDVDNGATQAYSGDATGTYGSFVVDASTGAWTYTLDNAAHQNLAQGESHTDTFTVTVTDDFGATTTQDVTVTINGTNDGPVITSGVQTGSVTEDTQLTATGQVQASDVDNGATQAYSGDATGTYGSFVVDASTGAWTYTLDNAAHQNLAQGESHTDTFTVTVTDDFGATTTQDVTVTINGTNDGPVITSGVQTGSVTEDTQLTATGQVQASDVDNGATQAYSGDATGTYGSFVVDASTGAWTYTLDNAAHQNLAQGESHTDTFTVTVTDDFGATTTQDVTVTINGTNDGPVITSGVQTGSVTEDTQLTATGQVQASDVDNGATQAYSGDATGTYGSFVVDASTGAWTYTLDNAAHQNLAQGESHTDTFTVTVTDDFGATTTQDVTVTINGTNDGPVITSGVQTGSVTEDTQLTATGQVQASDVDNGATQAYSGDATGTYGSFVVDASTGAWTYTLDNAAHQNLAQGESHTDTFTVTVTDDFGATTTQDVTVTINGTNDGPVITSGVQTGSVTEDTQLTATGQVQASDVDNGATQAYSGDATGTYGSFVVDASTGAWTYTLDNAAHQNLAQGESHTDTFTVTVTDDFGATTTQDVTVTINGTNDGPVITSGVQTGSVTEDTQLTATGQVQASDVDNGATQAYSGDATGTYGSFVVDASTGAWTYTLDNAAHQNLAQGESHTDTFTVTVTDDFGATTTQDVTVTINGTNDGPVITSGVQTGSVTEDTQLTATGQVQASDVDNGATQAYSGDATGTYGSFVVDASTGAWTYTLDNAAHQNLAQGESHTDTFTVTVTDDFGATTTQDVTVTINGTNDGPVITSGVQTGSVTEDTQLTATGQVQASDVDNGATQAYSGDATGTYGSFVVDASTGAWTYTLDNAAHQNLAQGESHTDTFTVTVTDDFGATTTQDVTVTINGTNDGPVITSGVQTGSVTEDTQLTATGQVQASDVDNGATQAYSGDATGTYGSFVVDASTGAWTYTLDNAAHQNLAQGESHTDTFTVTVTDDFGATTTQDVTVTINGTNDGPVITSGVQTGSVTEDTQLTATGQVQASDVDNGATQAYSGDATGTYGSFVVDASTGAWTYTLDNAAHQNLAQGESHTDTFTVTVTDDFGATTTQDVTVTINGTNDGPVITSGVQTGSVTEDTQLTATGQVQASDVDNGATQAYSGDATGTYGSFVVDASTGAWTYTLDNAAHQNLAQGESHTDTFTVTVTDDFGATTTQDVTVTINGTNDGPVITSGVQTGSVTEDTQLTATGQVQASDVDNGATQAYSGDATGTYGSFVVDASTGAWTYTLDNAAHQNLAQGESHTDTFTVTVTDDFGATTTQDVTVTINGTNDAPVAVADINSVKEDTAPNPVSGNVLTNDTDVDTGDTHSVTAVNGSAGNVGANLVGTYGTLHLNSDGTYTYTLNNGLASVQALAAGASVTDVFTYTNADNHGGSSSASLTVTINGTNDAPVAVADINSVKEDTAPNPVSGNVLTNDTDVDTGDTHSVTAVNGSAGNVGANLVGTYGTLHLNSDGTYTYTLNNGLASVQALAAGASVTDVFTYTNADNHGGPSSASLTVTINGTNDAPVAVADINSVKEDTAPNPVSGNVLTNDTDVDTGDTHSVTAVNGSAGNVGANLVGTYGTLHLNSDGTYTYTLNNGLASVQALAAGASVTDVFTYTNADNHGGSSSASLTVTINGTNDAPVAVADINSVKEDTAPNPVSGNVLTNDTDVDTGDTHSVTAVNGSAGNVGANLVGTYGTLHLNSDGTYTYTLNNGLASVQEVSGNVLTNDTDVDTGDTHSVTAVNGSAGNVGANLVGTYGTLHLNSDGTYTYTLNNGLASVQALAAGASVTDVFTYTNADNHGGSSSASLTVTINGTNDAPVAVADINSVKEDTAPNPVSGNVLTNDTDVDTGDTHSVTAVNGSAGNVGANLVGTYGTLHLNSDGTYTYTLNNGLASVQALAAGASVTDVFTYTNADNHGGSSSASLTVTINGTNDAPVAVADINSVKEDTAPNPVSGNVLTNDTDVDTGDTHSVTAVNGSAGNVGANLVGTYGTLHLNSDGTYTYTLNNGLASVQALAAGASVTDVFTYTNADNHGGSSSASLTVTINGTNDAPDIHLVATGTPDTASATLTETNAGLSTSGTLTVTDADVSDTVNSSVTTVVASGTTAGLTSNAAQLLAMLAVSPTSGLAANPADTHNLNWTFNSGTQAFDYLAAGQSLTLTYTVQSTDNNGASDTQTVTVTVNGTDEASNTLISQVVASKQSSNNSPSTAQITFNTTNIHANFVDITSAIHVSNVTNDAFIVAGSGHFDATTQTYSFDVNKGSGNNGSSYSVTIDAGAFSDSVGNTNTSFTKSGLKPAGTSGEPINLALTDPSHEGALITVTVKDVPSGWTIDGATHNADGSWTTQTSDLHGLTVTTPASFTGAAVLDVQMTWINADGTAGTASIADNVEAYAPGSPIFAWSGDDVLTGSHGNDLFVFSQPIGADTVHNFDAAADQIDLIGYNGLADFADLQTHIADDAHGNAMITLGDGQSITLDGVHSDALTGSNFVFDQTPVVNNSGTMTIGDGALLPLSGIINNSGLISLDSTGGDTLLQVIQHGVTLQGGGQILLSDSATNVISGTGPDVTLVNVDNTISGAGQLGGGMLSLDNGGTIIASGSNGLVIDTGGSVVINSGTLEATGSGGLTVAGGLANSGMLWANGGDIVIHGQVTGDGDATIGNLSKLEFGGASSTDVTFGHDAAGTLQLDDSFDYSGRIGGITNDDRLDLHDILFGAGTTAVYQANQDGSGGTLTVSDGTHGAALHLVGSYDANAFKVADDGQGHTVVSYNEFTLTGIGNGAISSDFVV
uniref:MadA n=3 Tax=Mesorhizobium TaxID=68287 RepID=A2I7R3_9HYPH|nr:MadA [Mesorhizobium sp. R88B]